MTGPSEGMHMRMFCVANYRFSLIADPDMANFAAAHPGRGAMSPSEPLMNA